MAEAGIKTEGHQKATSTWKKEIARRDLDKLKGHSILERQLEWRPDTEQIQCGEYVCRNVTDIWFTILIWETLTLSQTVQNKEFGKSSALNTQKPALQVPRSPYSTSQMTGKKVQKVQQQKNPWSPPSRHVSCEMLFKAAQGIPYGRKESSKSESKCNINQV